VNHRICACGTPIVCADLDGLPVWLDRGDGGWISIDERGDATVGSGPWRRHTCAADPAQVKLTSHRTGQTAAVKVADAAERNIQAARIVLESGVSVGPAQRRIAELRLRNPGLSGRKIAARYGIPYATFSGALGRLRQHAERINSTRKAA
jgi:hypothetical protein